MKILFRLSILILSCFIQQILNAQKSVSSAVKTTLDVGDQAPSIGVYKWIKGNPIKKFQKGRIYLVEFGATWCVPCAAAMPHLSAIAKEYQKDVTVLEVFVMEPKKDRHDLSYIEKVGDYVKKKGNIIAFNAGVDDPDGTIQKCWLAAASLDGIPKTFLVDRNGLIAWIGSPNPNSLRQVIEQVKSVDYSIGDMVSQTTFLKTIEPAKVDIHQPLYINGNGGRGDSFLFRSILTPYKGEKTGNIGFVYSGYRTKWKPEVQLIPGMVQQVGASIDKLYYIAYGDTLGQMVNTRRFETNEFYDTAAYPLLKDAYGNFWYKAILEVSDSSKFIYNSRSHTNLYNYSLIVPNEKANAAFLQTAMQKDLQVYFGYQASVEKRWLPYWKLTISSDRRNQLKTKTPGEKYRTVKLNDSTYLYKNAVVKDVLNRLIYAFSYSFSNYGSKPRLEEPFIDETKITEEIDYDITMREFEEMGKGNWSVTLDFLHRLGFELERSYRWTNVVVIKDPKN